MICVALSRTYALNKHMYHFYFVIGLPLKYFELVIVIVGPVEKDSRDIKGYALPNHCSVVSFAVFDKIIILRHNIRDNSIKNLQKLTSLWSSLLPSQQGYTF